MNDDAAIVFNNGVDIDFTMFDVFVTTVAVEDNDFRYRNPDNMQEMYEKTVEEQKDPNDLDMELYIGLYKGEDPTALDGYGYQFS